MNLEKLYNKPIIGISQCLLGDRVRYDAQIKNYPHIIDFVKLNFEVISICPEVEIGLTVPRPAVQLSGTLLNIHIIGRDTPSINISDAMHNYCKRRITQLSSIHGYIFKSKSPSCGIKDIPIFNSNNEVIALTQGVFANAVLQKFPQLPVIDEEHLLTTEECNIFLKKVKQFQNFLCLKNS